MLIAADHIRKVKEEVRQIKVTRGVERREIPNPEPDQEGREVRLNGKPVDLAPQAPDLTSDAKPIDEFKHRYRNYFSAELYTQFTERSTPLT